MEANYYYAALGLSHGATSEEIAKAYRKFARKYHPDLNQEASAIRKFKEINEAYWVLSDPGRRRDYDRSRMDSIADQNLMGSRVAIDPTMEDSGQEARVASRHPHRGSGAGDQPSLPSWVSALIGQARNPKVLIACAIALATFAQADFGVIPFLPGSWTGFSGSLAPIAATFEALTVVDDSNPHAAPRVVRIKPDGTYRVVLAPGIYTLWASDASCAGSLLQGGLSLSLGSGQHVEIGQPPFLNCSVAP